jgi:predicted O-methyltransferase YrrM
MKNIDTPLPALSPEIWRTKPAWSPSRLLLWTARRRYHETMARLFQSSLAPAFQKAGGTVETDAGAKMEHTAVTEGQMRMLLAAVEAAKTLPDPIVEIGSFRGVTTRALAQAAGDKPVIAVDPYLGEGGHDKDLALFRKHTEALSNVRLIKRTSDEAHASWDGTRISMVFIDAIHEYLHSWYDFAAWGSLIQPGGFVAFHDVDKFPGVNRACHRLLREFPEWQPWAHTPNLAIFRRATS